MWPGGAKLWSLYGADREMELYSAPGRTEIGGNHVDHNNGVVMAAAVDLDIIAVVSKNDENIVRVKSQGFEGAGRGGSVRVMEPQAREVGRSSALVRGVAAGILQLGGEVGGFDAIPPATVLRGTGLSSSAAFEVVIGAVFSGEFGSFRFHRPVEVAKIGQYAENVFFGKPSGLMDQTASSVGSAITIDFKDPSARRWRKVDFDLAKYGLSLCITDTKGSHADLTDDYAAIRARWRRWPPFWQKGAAGGRGRRAVCQPGRRACQAG